MLETLASVLPCVQEHPNLPSRRPRKNARKYSAATDAGVMLFSSLVFDCTHALKREVLVRRLSGRLAV